MLKIEGVRVYKILDKNTWKEEYGTIEGEYVITESGTKLPAKGLKKVIVETKGLLRKKLYSYYVMIVKSNSEAIDIEENGTWSTIEDPSIIEEAISKGLAKLATPPAIWWQWLMLILVGVLGGIGVGILIAHIVAPPVMVVTPKPANVPAPPGV